MSTCLENAKGKTLKQCLIESGKSSKLTLTVITKNKGSWSFRELECIGKVASSLSLSKRHIIIRQRLSKSVILESLGCKTKELSIRFVTIGISVTIKTTGWDKLPFMPRV